MTAVKICGLSREEDIAAVNISLPEWVGFVFSPSKRQVTPSRAKELCAGLAAGIKKVGVFVNETEDFILSAILLCGLDAVQLHGDEERQFIQTLRERIKAAGANTEILKAVRVKDTESIKVSAKYGADRVLYDAYSADAYGGTGRTFDKSLLGKEGCSECIISGGLDAASVGAIVKKYQPYGVDVSSGVETDGCKDSKKIALFIKSVRKMENEYGE